MNKKLNSLVVLSCICVLGACSYSVSVNDNLVYTPEPLFSDFKVADTGLQHCLKQTIENKKITAPSQLKALNCSSAGITSLAGIEQFSAIEELNLASNKLQSIDPLSKLTQLKLLLLYENQLTHITPLLQLLHLTKLDLADNPELECGDVQQLANNMAATAAEIIKPEQCR